VPPPSGPPRYAPPPSGPPRYAPPPRYPPPAHPFAGPAPVPNWGPPSPASNFYERQRSQNDTERQYERRRKRRRTNRNLAIIGSFVAFVALCFGSIAWLGNSAASYTFEGDVVMHSAGNAPAPLPGDEQAAPLPTVAPFVRPPGVYSFLGTNVDGSPVAWDPCEPVRYVVNASGAPKDGEKYLADSLARISAASGIVFVNEGASDELPSLSRRTSVILPSGDPAWVPVLIAWGTSETIPDLQAGVLGFAMPVPVRQSSGYQRYVTGMVALDTEDLDQVRRSEGAAAVRGVIEHELSHLLGLDHVDDASQLMNPETDFHVNDLQAGDLTGLSAVGKGPCFG